MDDAVSLVETYLRINGYFTATEFPVVELPEAADYRTATDLDILAVRFPTARRLVPGDDDAENWAAVLDSALGIRGDEVDMIDGGVRVIVAGRVRVIVGASGAGAGRERDSARKRRLSGEPSSPSSLVVARLTGLTVRRRGRIEKATQWTIRRAASGQVDLNNSQATCPSLDLGCLASRCPQRLHRRVKRGYNAQCRGRDLPLRGLVESHERSPETRPARSRHAR